MTAVSQDHFAHLLHGTARAWRVRLDEQLKPLGMSQARWRTLLHLSFAKGDVTQAELAAQLGIEEPTLVNLLHRLEASGWVKRVNAAHDRRCKTLRLEPRARRVIDRINATARDLRSELMADISAQELEVCSSVLQRIRRKAENGNVDTAKPRVARKKERP